MNVPQLDFRVEFGCCKPGFPYRMASIIHHWHAFIPLSGYLGGPCLPKTRSDGVALPHTMAISKTLFPVSERALKILELWASSQEHPSH